MSVLLDNAKTLRESGKTFKEIADELKCSEGYLRKSLAGFHKRDQNASVYVSELERVQEIVKNLLEVARGSL